MPLTMNTDGRLSMPGVTCDVCGEPIKKAREGNAQWMMDEEGNNCTIYFTHKACCHTFDVAHPTAGAQELSHFLVFLVNNLKMDWEKAKKGAAQISSID
jgi:hypothetical protein